MPPPEYFQDNATFVYRSIFHRRPIVNGYSGFIPKSYRRAYGLVMRENLARSLVVLSREGVRFVVAHTGRLGPRMKRQLREAEESGVLRLVGASPPDRLYAVIVREGDRAREASRSPREQVDAARRLRLAPATP